MLKIQKQENTHAEVWMEPFVTIGNGLEAVNYYHKVLHLGCCSSPRSVSDYLEANLKYERIQKFYFELPPKFCTEIPTFLVYFFWISLILSKVIQPRKDFLTIKGNRFPQNELDYNPLANNFPHHLATSQLISN